ncbi:BTB/POZ domain-containing protein [Acorus gramineus]|uniref:BTB/POZ domain-containing protein n=1 Tax=Acorus gramineus TaxID=55184 RepID=A0AAV9ANN0_ACOGR|nr:BTB/POZ domain-containing protein [Acorus gramineus]
MSPSPSSTSSASAAETILKTGEVSAMIKQGFLSSPTKIPSPLSSPPPNYKPNSPTTLFDMISAEEHQQQQQQQHRHQQHFPNRGNPSPLQDRIKRILDRAMPGFSVGGDVALTVSARDGSSASVSVHRRVLSGRSGFFAERLRRAHSVEICDCDDVEVYLEAVALMYEVDVNRRLVEEGVEKVLGLLKVSVAIMFDDGIKCCLEYLEAVPWSEDEEEKIISTITELQLHSVAGGVMRRISVEPSTSDKADDIFSQLLAGVLHAKDEKARREIKSLISGLLREDTFHQNNISKRLDVSRETLYHLCHKCLSSLLLCLSEAAVMDESRRDRGVLMGEIAREADNLLWIVNIIIDKKMGDEFVKLWADQKELASLHSRIPCMYRHEISRITAQLCIAIGRGQLLVPKEDRFSMLQRWLDGLYEDFGWMKRACGSVDKKMVEDGLGQTILTLPLEQQQAMLLNWFDRFLNKGDDCPNIQRAFQIWWRRAFVRQYGAHQDQSQMQIAVCDYPS